MEVLPGEAGDDQLYGTDDFFQMLSPWFHEGGGFFMRYSHRFRRFLAFGIPVSILILLVLCLRCRRRRRNRHPPLASSLINRWTVHVGNHIERRGAPGNQFVAVCTRIEEVGNRAWFVPIEEDVESFKSLCSAMNEYYRRADPLPPPTGTVRPQFFAVSRHGDEIDNMEEEQWCRAECVGVLEESFHMLYVDYGTEERNVPYTRVRELQDEYTNVPCMACCCQVTRQSEIELLKDGLHDYCKPFETSPNHFLVTVEEEEEEDDITVVTVKRLDRTGTGQLIEVTDSGVENDTEVQDLSISFNPTSQDFDSDDDDDREDSRSSTPTRSRSWKVNQTPPRELQMQSFRLQEREVVYGKYFVKGSSLCSVLFEWTGDGGNTTVAVKGKFTNEKEVPLTKEEDAWKGTLDLPIGRHTFIFVVDGVSTVNPHLPTMEDDNGELVNYIDVASLEWRKAVEVHILGDTPTKTIVIEEEEESTGQELTASAEGTDSLTVDAVATPTKKEVSGSSENSFETIEEQEADSVSDTFAWGSPEEDT